MSTKKTKSIIVAFFDSKCVYLENVISYGIVSGTAGKLMEVKMYDTEDPSDRDESDIISLFYSTTNLSYIGPGTRKQAEEFNNKIAHINVFEEAERAKHEQFVARKKIHKEYVEKYPDFFKDENEFNGFFYDSCYNNFSAQKYS